MKKKALLYVACLSLAAFAVGCGGEKEKASLNVTDSVLTMDCFEERILEAETENVKNIQWESSDPSIVSVDENGKLTSKLKTGKATITASYGKVSDSCEVTVLQKSGMPSLSLEQELILSEGGSYAVTAQMLYNGVNIAGELVFALQEGEDGASSVSRASVEGATLTFYGETVGSTYYVLSTTVFDCLYTERIDVTVRNTDVVYVVKNGVNNQLEVKEGSTPSTSDVQIYDKNVRVPNDSLTWEIEDETIAELSSDGKILMKKEGTTLLSTVYKDEKISVGIRVVKKHEKFSFIQDGAKEFNLNVNIVIDSKNNKRSYVANDGQVCTFALGDASISGEVIRASLDGETLNGEYFSFENGILSAQAKAFDTNIFGEKTLTFDVETVDWVYSYEMKVFLVTKALTKATDFKDAIVAKWQGDKIVGYFTLAANIDLEWQEISVWATDWKWDNGFRGTLDGRGYSIEHVKSTMYGLSAQMGNGAVLKNLKFPSFRYSGGNTTLFARGAGGTTFENIEITLTADSACTANGNALESGVLCSYDIRRCVYKDITIHAEGKALQRIFGGQKQEINSCTHENILIYAKSVTYYEHDSTEKPNGVTLIEG